MAARAEKFGLKKMIAKVWHALQTLSDNGTLLLNYTIPWYEYKSPTYPQVYYYKLEKFHTLVQLDYSCAHHATPTRCDRVPEQADLPPLSGGVDVESTEHSNLEA